MVEFRYELLEVSTFKQVRSLYKGYPTATVNGSNVLMVMVIFNDLRQLLRKEYGNKGVLRTLRYPSPA